MEGLKLRGNERVEFNIDGEVYKSNVQDIISDQSIVISVPISGAKNYIPMSGETIEFFILTGSEFYKYKAKYKNKFLDGNLRLLLLDDLSFIGKIQRREYYRVPVSVDLQYALITEMDAAKGVSKRLIDRFDKGIKSITIDLSAGGVKFISKENMGPNTYMIMRLRLYEDMYVIAKVIRVERDIVMKNYKVSCKFHKMEKVDSEKMVKFIFEKSRELIKR